MYFLGTNLQCSSPFIFFGMNYHQISLVNLILVNMLLRAILITVNYQIDSCESFLVTLKL